MKKLNWFSLISLIIIFVLFLNLLCAGNISKLFINEEAESKEGFDWEELYPFDEKVEIVGAPVFQKKMTIYDKIESRMEKYAKIGETNSKSMLGYNTLAFAGLFANSLLTDLGTGRGYLKLENGRWVRTAGKVDISAYQKIANQYNAIERYAEDLGIYYLYVQTPTTVDVDNEQIPEGVEHFGNERIDSFIQAMVNNEMNYLDLRENFKEDNIDFYSYFYKTDHHWTIEAGLYVASEIVSEINDRTGTNMPRADEIGDYGCKTYENAMFGSIGNSLSHYVLDSEDFTIFYPLFSTYFHLVIPDKDIDTYGSFEELFYDYESIESIQNEGGGYVYETVVYGNRPLITIENLNNQNGPHIVMIRDSYGIAVAPFLALSCSRLDLIDTRDNNGNFNGSILNYLKTEKPDIVIVLEKTVYEINLNK